MSFERGALGLVGVLLVVLVAVVVSDPAAGKITIPKAILFLESPKPAPEILADKPLDWETASGALAGNTAHKLSSVFVSMGYDLEAVISGKNAVPRLFLANMPHDMSKIRESRKRKSIFFKTLLPLVLKANSDIRAERRRLWRLRFQLAMGEAPTAAERLWLTVMAERYRVKNADADIGVVDMLLHRADVIPVSLALAQAAEESGWGTSRFAREGNAIFGQWTFSKRGHLQPLKRDDGKTHRIRAFGSLLDSVKAYALNLNTHRAYRGFRKERQKMRATGAPLVGKSLVANLKSYSARGAKYVKALNLIIAANNLDQLDGARLGDTPKLSASPPSPTI